MRLTVLLLVVLLATGCWWRDDEEELIVDNQELYETARVDIAEGKFFRAAQRLGEVGLMTAVSPEIDPYVKLALADAYFYRDGTINAIEAQSRYEQFLSFYPTHELAPYARYQIGVCLFEQSERPENDQEYTERARKHFEDMLRDLRSDDPWRLPAAAMRQRAEDQLARHEWQVASFYMDKEKPLGVISRLEDLLRRYPGAIVREQAFFRLAMAYADVGDFPQAQLTLDMMVDEYPASGNEEKVVTLRERIERGLGGGGGADDGTASREEVRDDAA